MGNHAPDLLTEPEKKRIRSYWEKNVAERIEKKIGVGHSNDPLLNHTLDNIRDGYIQLFAERRYLQKMLQKDPDNRDLATKLDDLKYDEISHTHQSLKRLTEPGFDYYSPAQRAHFDQIEQFTGPGKPLTTKQAASVMGTIVKGSLDAFESLNRFYKRENTPRMQVNGRMSMLSSPDTLNMERSQSRKKWVESLEHPPEEKDRTR